MEGHLHQNGTVPAPHGASLLASNHVPQGKQGGDSCHDGSEETEDMMVGAATSDGIAREGTLKT